MILLLGGTSETAPIATALAEAGYDVLVSTATEIALDIGCHERIRRRSGRLDLKAMLALALEERVRAIVDATHPYAVQAHAAAREAARALRIPCFTYTRPSGLAADADVCLASSHEEAARLACRCGGPILLTIGSRNLLPYVKEARRDGTTLIARVLPEAESLAACRAAGLAPERIVALRGPFSLEANRELIRRFGIRTLVTKDGGATGGLPEKLKAAELEHCRVVVLQRPKLTASHCFSDIPSLVQAVSGFGAPE